MADASLTASGTARVAATQAQLDAVFVELEAQRRQVLRSVFASVSTMLLCLLLAVLPIPLLFEFTNDGPGTMSGEVVSFMNLPMAEAGNVAVIITLAWLLAWIVAGFRIFWRFGQQPRWRYLQRFKTDGLSRLCQLHFPGIHYQASAGIDWKILDDSELFPFACDGYRSEDRFSGHWGSTDVTFAEATADRERQRLSSNGLDTATETYFKGLIFCADFHKHFRGTTRLIPRGEEVRDNLREHPATFEDPRFEALFDTRTSDQVEVRYLLSSSMLHRFCELHSRFPKLRARFHNGQLLLLLPSSYDRFEASLFRNASNRGQLKSLLRDLQSCLSVVDELNLNTRIWSKA